MTPTWKDYCGDKNVAGTFENQVLYAMCRDYPCHDCIYVNVGKVVAIGRIYAAPLERGSGTPKETGTTLVNTIGRLLANSKIDKKIDEIQFTNLFSRETISSVIKVHMWLVDLIVDSICKWSSTSQDKKPRKHASFASKYLHFHRPNTFPIMDSFARAGLNCSGQKGALGTYEAFCEAMIKHIETLNHDWTLRSLDDDLVLRGRAHTDKTAASWSFCKRIHVTHSR